MPPQVPKITKQDLKTICELIRIEFVYTDRLTWAEKPDHLPTHAGTAKHFSLCESSSYDSESQIDSFPSRGTGPNAPATGTTANTSPPQTHLGTTCRWSWSSLLVVFIGRLYWSSLLVVFIGRLYWSLLVLVGPCWCGI